MIKNVRVIVAEFKNFEGELYFGRNYIKKGWKNFAPNFLTVVKKMLKM